MNIDAFSALSWNEFMMFEDEKGHNAGDLNGTWLYDITRNLQSQIWILQVMYVINASSQFNPNHLVC